MLKLNDIGLSFANKKQVLDDITLTLNQKEIVGLVATKAIKRLRRFIKKFAHSL